MFYDRQPVALVVADTFERATDAASRVRVSYDRKTPRDDDELAGCADLHAAAGEPKPGRHHARGLRRRLRDRAGEARQHLRHADRVPQPDGAARDARDVVRRPADDLRRGAGRLLATREHREDLRHPGRRRARRGEVRRRRLRLERRYEPAPRAGGDGRQGDGPSGQDRVDPPADVRRFRQPAAHRAARADRRRPHAASSRRSLTTCVRRVRATTTSSRTPPSSAACSTPCRIRSRRTAAFATTS